MSCDTGTITQSRPTGTILGVARTGSITPLDVSVGITEPFRSGTILQILSTCAITALLATGLVTEHPRTATITCAIAPAIFSGSAILTEDGFYLKTEHGFKILLE